jgi:hypothetical protein
LYADECHRCRLCELPRCRWRLLLRVTLVIIATRFYRCTLKAQYVTPEFGDISLRDNMKFVRCYADGDTRRQYNHRASSRYFTRSATRFRQSVSRRSYCRDIGAIFAITTGAHVEPEDEIISFCQEFC